jgi:hypothetical protein
MREGVDRIELAQFCELVNGPFGYVKGSDFLNELSDCQLFMKDYSVELVKAKEHSGALLLQSYSHFLR